jgi:ribosomal protein S16
MQKTTNEDREMNVVEPKRLTGLESFTLRLQEYSSLTDSPGSTELSVNGFTTIADLKRQIWIQHRGNPEWSPNRIWIAQPAGEGLYKPLDMSWDEQPDFEDGIPLPSLNPGSPDPRLVDSEGNRKAIYPILNEGLLLESVFPTERPPLVVFTLESLVREIGTMLENPAVLNGYIQMYFPKIQTVKEAIEASDESYKLANEYIKQRAERIADIDKLLKSEKVQESEPFKLRHLRRWKAIIPKHQDKSLDILFYEFRTSHHLPFLRYFPSKGRSPPLLKLATGPAGFPLISDKDMLAAFLDEEPNLEFGGVLVAKIPFETLSSEVRATRNVAMSIYWLEDGSSYVLLEAPRRDMPLEFNVFDEAQKLLMRAIESVGYPPETPIHLDELSASYRIEIASSKKLSQKDVMDRVPFFSPFIEASSYQDKSNTKVNLKWKVVNNYEHEGAVYSYLTKRVLDDDINIGEEAKERIQLYIQGVMEEFGRSEVDAKRLFDDWFRRRAEVVPTGADPVSAHNTGVEIEITLSHPVYFVSFVGIDSQETFTRVVSIMTAFFYYTSKAHVEPVAEAPKAPVVDKVVAVQAAARAAPEMAAWMGFLGDEEEEEELAEEQVAVAPPQAPAPGDARKQTLEPLKEWYKDQLDLYDVKLFGYSQTDKTVTVYSRTCQASSARQPNVMVAEQLDALVKEYGDAVEWVFLPPPENIILDVSALSNKELIQEMVTRGFKDIVDAAGKPTKKKAELQKIFEDALCSETTLQGQFCRILRKKEKGVGKPIWFVARAGTDKPNYYICSEYWCVRDMKPLIPSEFKNTQTRHGAPKNANSCPFCGGTILEELKHPKMGQTVIKRKGKPGKGEIHEIAGYMDNIHPNKFALPCCFTRPTVTQMKPGEGTEPLPVDRRKEAEEVAPAQEQVEEEDDKDENEALTKVLRTIRTQYVLKYEKRQLEPGRIGLCPPVLDELLGQQGTQSVMKSVGVAQHFKPTAKVFVRFGLGNRGTSPGLNFLELLGFYMGNLQVAGKPPTKGTKLELPTVLTPAAVVRKLFPEKPTKADEKFLLNMRRAFERANYGTLVHEFAGSADELEQGQIQEFAKQMGFSLKSDVNHMRPHVVRLANAWHNFVAYVKDEQAPKNLAHFENLFATPNVFFPDGLLLIIFEGHTDDEGNQTVKIRCPEYGVSEYSQKFRPPISFLWHDIATNAYEPLIYVEGLEELDKKSKQQYIVFPTIHTEDPKFQKIDPEIQSSLRDYIKQYLSFTEGCGRYSSPAHPWMPDLNSATVPKVSELLKLKTPEAEPIAILRDRSNRFTGLIYKISGKETQLFVPALEDGSLGLSLKSVYDTESLPMPPLDDILTIFAGKTGLGKIKGLAPSEILIQSKERKYSALRLACGAIVPFAPIAITSTATHPLFTALVKKGAKPIAILPWAEDIRFLRMTQLSSETMDVIPESVVEEAYQYLRISLSEWLKTDDRDAKKVLRQLIALRDSNLPLYELRRRGDILLEPIIHNWIDVSKHTENIPALSLLRKDCRVESKEECSSSPMCSWIGSECKIHAGSSTQIPDVKVYYTSRIIDELMRYPAKSSEILEHGVSKIRPPLGLVRTKDGILTSKNKITDLVAELDLNYVPQDEYSAGLTYPEDAHDEMLQRPLRLEHIELPQEWKRAGLYRLVPDPVIEDRFVASLTTATSMNFKAIQTLIKNERKRKGLKAESQVQWNDADWWCFSQVAEINIIITRYARDTETARAYKWFRSHNSDFIMVVLMIDSPEILQYTKTSTNDRTDLPPIQQKLPAIKDLPKSLQTFMDNSFALNWEAVKESI